MAARRVSEKERAASMSSSSGASGEKPEAREDVGVTPVADGPMLIGADAAGSEWALAWLAGTPVAGAPGSEWAIGWLAGLRSCQGLLRRFFLDILRLQK